MALVYIYSEPAGVTKLIFSGNFWKPLLIILMALVHQLYYDFAIKAVIILIGKKKTRWEEIMIHGNWVRRVSAGGCRNYLDTFWTNPQYRVTIVDPDENDADNTGILILLAILEIISTLI